MWTKYANGMVDRLYRRMKQALTSYSKKRWVDRLPLALLDIRKSYKEDLHCTTAEMVYRIMLALPAYFLVKANNYAAGASIKQLCSTTQLNDKTLPTAGYLHTPWTGLLPLLREETAQTPSLLSIRGHLSRYQQGDWTITIHYPKGEESVTIACGMR